MPDYDVVVIGSGVGGTSIGAILTSKGLKTLLIEKNEFIGGRCSSYEKEGFKIDVGAHVFGRTSRGPLGKILNMIEMEREIEWVLARDPGPRWFYQGKFWKFPREFKELIPNSDFSSLMKLFRDVLRIKETKDLDSTNVSSFLSQYSKDPLVHTFINIISMLYLVVPYYEASAGEFLRCLSSLAAESSIGYPKGGCISIPSAYTKGIEKYGGKVKTRTTVNKIVVEDEKVRGVELDDGELITSNIVISNAGIKSTINDLVGRNNFSKDYLKLIDKLKYTVSALTLKIALKKPITEFKVITSFSLQNPEKKINSILKGKVPDDIDLFIPVPSNFDPGLVPNGRQLIIAGTPVPTANFEQNKETWINNVLKKLNIVFPKLKDNLLWWDISTPEDIEFLGGKEASVIGIAQNTDQSGSNRPSTSLPIEGLYIVGGDAGGWGIGTELAATSAIECAEKIVKNKSGK